MFTAVRACVEALKPHRKRGTRDRTAVPWRLLPYGQRVLVFDTETTTDAAQRLLFGFFRLYDRDGLILEGIIAADVLAHDAMAAIAEYAAKCRLPIYSRERFVEEVFYWEVYVLGTLCVGFHLAFDLARIAIHAGIGRGENRRKFRIVLSRRLHWHDLRIESASGKAAFIGFVPKTKLRKWERPFFPGRFCDVSMVARAFSGKRHTLHSAGDAFGAYTRKMRAPEFGVVDRASLLYGRQDVRATWALYKALRTEYSRHPFATFANERRKPKNSRYIGELYSTASIAKQYLRLLGIAPLLEKEPGFDRKYLGWFMSAYFGGRSDVRVRKIDTPVRLLDFTAMYATIFCLQRIDRVLTAPRIRIKPCTAMVRALLGDVARDNGLLFDPRTWLKLNCLVLVDPNGAILPIRMRKAEKDPYTIAVTPIDTPEGRWYPLGDVLGGMLLGGPMPTIRKAIRVVPEGRRYAKTVRFRDEVELRSTQPFFKTIVEQRQIAKDGAKTDRELAALERGLKEMAAGGAYGIYAEVNVTPAKSDDDVPGEVYADIVYSSPSVHDERPGAYTNPIIASLVTGGARLMLALLESEVIKRGGTSVFCDTDSLAITCGDNRPKGIPCLPASEIDAIVKCFDALNPYDQAIVPHLLKVEYAEYPDLRCFAVSAKRYVLYRVRLGDRIEIIKASESALGAIIGRTVKETTKKLARRIWLAILMRYVPVNPKQRRRAKPLVNFDVPLRRKFPISQPAILKRLEAYNKTRSYDFRVKPAGFVQTVAPDRQIGNSDVLPIAPYETDVRKAMKLQWVDFNTGNPIRLDWHRTAMAGTIGVTRLADYVDDYQRHPEAKAADCGGSPAVPETIGLLGRLRVQSRHLARIGKEVDRLREDEAAALEPEIPIEYQRDTLAEDIAYLAQFPRAVTARDLGLSPRGWFSLIEGESQARETTAARIRELAAEYRERLGRE